MNKNYLIVGISLGVLSIITISLTMANDGTLPFLLTNDDDEDDEFDDENEDEDLNEADYLDQISISRSQAEAIALDYTTGGDVLESELELENGVLVWEVDINFDGEIYQIVVDANTGEVLEAELDD